MKRIVISVATLGLASLLAAAAIQNGDVMSWNGDAGRWGAAPATGGPGDPATHPICGSTQRLFNDDAGYRCVETSGAMPECSNGQIIKVIDGGWACEPLPVLLPTCANGQSPKMIDGGWACEEAVTVIGSQTAFGEKTWRDPGHFVYDFTIAGGSPTYTVSPAVSGEYPDNGGVELMDSVMNAAPCCDLPTCAVGWSAGDNNVAITVDLGVDKSVWEARAYVGRSGMCAVGWPSSMTVATSMNGTDFTTRQVVTPDPPADNHSAWIDANAFGPVLAHYVRITIVRTSSWLMVGEVEINPGSTPGGTSYPMVTANGPIESTYGGFKFPDGTYQVSAPPACPAGQVLTGTDGGTGWSCVPAGAAPTGQRNGQIIGWNGDAGAWAPVPGLPHCAPGFIPRWGTGTDAGWECGYSLREGTSCSAGEAAYEISIDGTLQCDSAAYLAGLWSAQRNGAIPTWNEDAGAWSPLQGNANGQVVGWNGDAATWAPVPGLPNCAPGYVPRWGSGTDAGWECSYSLQSDTTCPAGQAAYEIAIDGTLHCDSAAYLAGTWSAQTHGAIPAWSVDAGQWMPLQGSANGQVIGWNGDAGVWSSAPINGIPDQSCPAYQFAYEVAGGTFGCDYVTIPGLVANAGTNGQTLMWNGDAGYWAASTPVVGTASSLALSCPAGQPVTVGDAGPSCMVVGGATWSGFSETLKGAADGGLAPVNGGVPYWNGDAGVWTAAVPASGSGAARNTVVFASIFAANAISAAPATQCAVAATNLNTTYKWYGAPALVKMDSFANAEMAVQLQEGSLQTGTISVDIYNATDGTTLVGALTSTSATCVTATATASSINLTGEKLLACRVKGGNSSDDPIFGSCVVHLW